MFEGKAFLDKIHIENFMSLRDVTLPLKPLTIFVGPNASGKSNTVTALYRLHKMRVDDRLSSDEFNRDTLWETEVPKFSFHLHTKVEKNRTLYHLEVKLEPDLSFRAEQLSVNDVSVISIQDGQGTVRDENGENETNYNSNELALGSAGNYGNKPITRALAEFMKEWKFYDFSPDLIRSSLTRSILLAEKEIRELPKLDSYGLKLPEVLCNWEKNFPERFENVSDSLASSTNRHIDSFSVIEENQPFPAKQLFLLEGYREPIPLHSASDGILRLIAYNILLNEPELPPLIAIEEPERNFHPGALSDIANVLEHILRLSSQPTVQNYLGRSIQKVWEIHWAFYCYATIRVSAQRCLTLKITEGKGRHLMVGLQISELVVPSLIVDSCQMKWRIQPNAKHKNLDFRVRP